MTKPSTSSFNVNRAWKLIGILFAWVVICAFFQQGLVGYLKTFLVLIAGILIAYIGRNIGLWILGLVLTHWRWLAGIAVLAAWIVFAGTYSLGRDLAVFALALGIAFAICAEGRTWVRRRLGDDPIPFPSGKRTALSWVVLSWFLASGADAVFERQPVLSTGTVVQPATMPPEWSGLRVGVALSGGGYRAALVHTGVLTQLGALGVPVTNLSTVSGGSIIGAYVAAGGSPTAFAYAVRSDRFRFARDLTDVQNVLRLPAPAILPWLDVDIWPIGASRAWTCRRI